MVHSLVLIVMVVTTASTSATIGSPLVATVGVIKQRVLMGLCIRMQIVIKLGLQLSNGRTCGGSG